MTLAEFKEKYSTESFEFVENLLRDLAMMKSGYNINFSISDLGLALTDILEVLPKSINEL